MKLSVILSIFNRSTLLERGLRTIDWQTMSKNDFEIIIIDDNSTEDLKKVYEPYIGKMNIRHIKYDKTKHDFYTKEEDWYHTQAISGNIGINQAKGEILCIQQPEMLLSRQAYEVGYKYAMEGKAVFGEILLTGKTFRDWLEKN